VVSEESDWREQLTLKLDRLKEKSSDSPQLSTTAVVDDFRNREFVKPGKHSPPTGGSQVEISRPEYHPLAEKALEKIDRAKMGAAPEVSRGDQAEPAVASGSEVRERPARHRRSQRPDKVERIEITLNQATLPFDRDESEASRAEEELRTGLVAAPIVARIRAGLIDAIFVSGCFLIFLLIVFFVPDFVFLTRSALLGVCGVWLLIFSSYFYLFIALGNRTLGMDHERLQIVTFRGAPLTAQEAGLRCFGYVVSLGLFGLGFLWAYFDPDGLTWHDKISSTLIIQSAPASTNSDL
jgi:uncharacterized RDD family membrane protein YckC